MALSQQFNDASDPAKVLVNGKADRIAERMVRHQGQQAEARFQRELQKLIKREKPELRIDMLPLDRDAELRTKAKAKVEQKVAQEVARLQRARQNELRKIPSAAIRQNRPAAEAQQEKRAQLADRQSRQRHKLEADIEKQYGANRRQLQKQQQDIQQRRGQTGWRGLLYQVSGRNRRDREAEKGIAKTLTNIQQRETEAREALTISQAAEESSLDRPAEQARTAEQQIEGAEMIWGQDAGLSATFDRAAEGRDDGRSRSAEDHSPHRDR